MQGKTLAPWAEAVVGADLLSADDLLALPDDSRMYELVEGSLVRMAPGGGEASLLGVRVSAALLPFVEAHNLGVVTGADGTFILSQPGDPDTALVPDVAFIRSERVPPHTSPEYAWAWRLAPDLVGEIASPTQSRHALAAKARRYLAAGVRLVWVIWPRDRQVDVWRPGDDTPSASLGLSDTLDGLDILPGFIYPVDRLFR